MRPRRQRAVGSARCDPPIVAWMRRALRRECPTAGTVAAPPPCQRALSYRPTLPRSAQPMPATAARRNRAGNKSRRERGMPGRLRARPSPGSRETRPGLRLRPWVGRMPKFCQERAKAVTTLAAWICDAAAAATLHFTPNQLNSLIITSITTPQMQDPQQAKLRLACRRKVSFLSRASLACRP